jgi:hypothetical protein
MLDALIAIFIMFVANLLITFSRTRLTGFVRRITSIFAFLLLFPALLFILRALL